ncbi:MAG TPA: 5'/3'-nucleotidase SurE [Dysgonamonadaceae bacterium]|nr:5'/3'-nucleotidase SurE [Dysgonamonadaceae bacterium]
MTNKKRPLILITNDDGFRAKGIRTLTAYLKDVADIIVFAPDQPQSGMSSAITSINPLRYFLHKEEDNVTTYICNGTPVDCVKLSMNVLDRKPDLIFSGINHGSNAAISVIYSGTMGAAIEGCIAGIPSVGISLCDFGMEADFSQSGIIATKIAKKVLKEKLPNGVCLNVNVPKGEVKGIQITSQTKGKWTNEYYLSKDGVKRDVYWLRGSFDNWEVENDETDEWALSNGYAAVVPVKINMTDYDTITKLKHWEEVEIND